MGKFLNETIHLSGLRVDCIIGVRPHEREKPQPLILSLTIPWDFSAASSAEALAETVDYSQVAAEARRFVQEGKFQLLETLARRLADHLGIQFDLRQLDLHVRKPLAVADSDGAAVSLTWIGGEDAP